MTNLQELAVCIHSIDYALKCRVCSLDGSKLTISPISGKTDVFQIHDPVVLIYLEGGHAQLLGGDVGSIDCVEKEVTILLPVNINEDRRLFERYPISMAISARRKFSNRRIHFLGKNLSLFGIGAVSDADLDVDEAIDIDLITGRYAFYISGKVVWKKPVESGFEYGFQLTHFDVATKINYETYLNNLKSEYHFLYIKAR